MATSFAIALDLELEDFLTCIGHDGRKIVFPAMPEPMNRAGHHVQECIEVARALGNGVTPIEFKPMSMTLGGTAVYTHIVDLEQRWEYFHRLVVYGSGVVDGFTPKCGHAMAFSKGHLCDPDTGKTFVWHRNNLEARSFTPRCLWLIQPLKTP